MKKQDKVIRFLCIVLSVVLLGVPSNVFAGSILHAQKTEHTAERSTQNAKDKKIKRKVKKKNAQITVELYAGLDGVISYTCPYEVRVKLSSKEDFTGQLRLTPKVEEYEKQQAYGQEVELAAGAGKTYSFVITPYRKAVLELFDEKGKCVYAEDVTFLNESLENKVAIGIMSEDPAALQFLDGMKLSIGAFRGVSRTLEIRSEEIPERAEALSILSYLVIDTYDTANLSDTQYDVLKQWVADGGVLILATGTQYQNVLHRFSDDFITGTFEDPKECRMQWKENNQDTWSLDGIQALKIRCKGAKEMTNFSNSGAAYRKEIGDGAVVLLSYSMAMEPYVSYGQREKVAGQLLIESATPQLVQRLTAGADDRQMDMGYSLAEVASLLDNGKHPNVALFALILIGYAVIVGPFLYLFLKKIQKREKMWGAVPVLTLVFTVGIYVAGMPCRVKKPVVSHLDLLELKEEEQKETAYLNILCPQAKHYDILLKKGFQELLNYNTESMYSYVVNTQEQGKAYDSMMEQRSDGMHLHIQNGSFFDETQCTLQRREENTTGMFTLKLDCRSDGFDGTITNQTIYDLRNVVVAYEDSLYQIASLKKGETVTLNASDRIKNQYFGSYFEQYYQKKKGLEKNREQYMDYQIDTSLESKYAGYMDTSSKSGCIWGQVVDKACEIAAGDQVENTGKSVVCQTFTQEYRDGNGADIADITECLVTTNGSNALGEGVWGTHTYIYSDPITATYSFSNATKITSLENRDFERAQQKEQAYEEGYYASVEAYNEKKDAFEPIFEDSNTVSGKTLQRYLVDGTLILRYVPVDKDSMNYIPKIAAKGGK